MNIISNRRIGRLLIAGATAALALAGAWVYWAPPGQTTLQHDTVWSLAREPLVVSELVVGPSNVTLTISAGTTVYFRSRAGLAVAGRLLVEGTAGHDVHLEHRPDSEKLWAGISFVGGPLESCLQYVDFHGAGSEGSVLRLQHSNVTLDHVRFRGARCGAITSADSSFTLDDSVIESVGKHEAIEVRRIPAGGHLLVEHNLFFPPEGLNDAVDIEDCREPGATPRFVGNVFLGGEDDGLDIDNCDAWVEGNVFMGFHAAKHGQAVSCGISCSVKAEVVVTNNLFVGNDSAVMSKKNSHVLLLNNTFYGCRNAAVSLDEKDRGAGGVTIGNCVFENNGASFLHDERATQFRITNSVLPEAARWPDHGNSAVKPEYRDVHNGDFRLRQDSPLAGRGAAIPPEISRAAFP